MASQFYGRFTKLDPAITFGGFTAGGVIQFNSEPFQGTGPLIVEGTLQAVSGTTSKTLTFSRAMQQFSYTDSFGDEIYYEALMGGNIVQTAEPERGYSFRNSRAFRGSDSYDRCEPGDVVWFNGRGYLITAATPFASAPASTQWQGDDPVATVWVLDANINNLALPRDTYGGNLSAEEIWESDTTEVFGGNVLEIDNTGWEACTRFIYNRPSDSSPDPFYYPDNATFSSSPTSAEFWYNPFSRTFQLASHNTSRGNDYRTSYWVRGLEEWAATATTEVWAVENTDSAVGFTDSESPTNEDHVLMCAARIGGTFNRTFRIYKTAAGYPTLAIMYRTDAALDSACISVDMAGDTPNGYLTRATSATGSYNAFTPGPGFPPVMAGDYYDLRFQLTASTFTIAITDEGGSEDILFSGAIGSILPSSPSGWLGIAVWDDNGCRFSGFEAGEDTFLVRVGALGQMGVRVDNYSPSSFQGVAYSKTVAKKTAEDIQSLVNVTANGILMTVDNTDKQRDTYGLSGSNITIYSESSGDLIQVQEEAPASVPAGVGRGPQVTNTVDFYDPTDSATSKNRANWRDQVVIHDPDDEFQGIGGSSVLIMRNAVFDSTAPPTIAWTSYNPSGGSWNSMTAGTDYIGRWAAGLVFISSAFLTARAGEAVDDSLCFRAEGTRILHNGSQAARQFNDMAAALDEFDDLFISIGAVGGDGIACHGGATLEGSPVDYECVPFFDCSIPTGWGYGRTPNQMNSAAPYPQWVSGSKRFASQSYDSSPGNLTCGTNNRDLAGVTVDGLFSYEINPTITNPIVSDDILFGSTAVPPAVGTEINAGFSFNAPGFALNNVISGLPDGSTCVQAYTRARFTGLLATTIEIEYETRTIASLSTISNVTTTTDADNADITVALVLGRKDSVQVFDKDDNPLTIGDWSFKFLGSGATVNIPTGDWKRVDVTEAVQGLIDNRNSELNRLYMFPALAELPASADGLEGYLLSMIPSATGSITATDDCAFDYRYEVTATQVTAESMEFDTILARFRLPDGSLTPVLPIINPPHMVAP